jgi:hypothetical protein
VRVGRDFPPFEKSHTRITLGTMDEMKQAVVVFRKVLQPARRRARSSACTNCARSCRHAQDRAA